jgi:hypothetical protein
MLDKSSRRPFGPGDVGCWRVHSRGDLARPHNTRCLGFGLAAIYVPRHYGVSSRCLSGCGRNSRRRSSRVGRLPGISSGTGAPQRGVSDGALAVKRNSLVSKDFGILGCDLPEFGRGCAAVLDPWDVMAFPKPDTSTRRAPHMGAGSQLDSYERWYWDGHRRRQRPRLHVSDRLDAFG